MTQDLKTKLIQEAQERFDEMTAGCCCGDFCEGQRIHNQKIKDNLATEIGNAVEETEKRVREEMVIKPFSEKIHHMGTGIQKLYKFDNGYGASVVRFLLKSFFGDTNLNYGSYTKDESEWELAVIKWSGNEWELCYDSGLTDDVVGHLSTEEVEKWLFDIKLLTQTKGEDK